MMEMNEYKSSPQSIHAFDQFLSKNITKERLKRAIGQCEGRTFNIVHKCYKIIEFTAFRNHH